MVVAGVPDVLADSTGTSASTRPSATGRTSAPPSNKKKEKGKKGKKTFFSNELLVEVFADTRAYLLKPLSLVSNFLILSPDKFGKSLWTISKYGR